MPHFTQSETFRWNVQIDNEVLNAGDDVGGAVMVGAGHKSVVGMQGRDAYLTSDALRVGGFARAPYAAT